MSKEKTLNMSDRDKELARQAWTENDWDGYLNVPKLIQLVRADEREALKAENWTVIMREGCLVTWGDAEELGERVRAVIKARGDV